MPKKAKTVAKVSTKSSKAAPVTASFDWSKWNFIIFLTLALILMVTILSLLSGVKIDPRSKAGNACPAITSLPRPEDCPGGEWKFKRDMSGCEIFSCEVK